VRSAAWLALALALVATGTVAISSASAQRLARPFRCDDCISNYYYFDHAGTGTEDWNCGSSTYNGHDGSDFSLRGGIDAIERGHAVRAAADGEVLFAIDGNYDRCRIGAISECDAGTRCTRETANIVAIRHEHRITYYGHLRRGSVRVARGDRVTCGQVIGEIGSSGCSSNAHLHFEVRTLGSPGRAYDPFLGECSPRETTLWRVQGRYRGYPGLDCAAAPPPVMPPADAGMPEPDAGPPDSGPIEEDAGEPAADAGPAPGDGGDPPTPRPDAKPRPAGDAEATPPPATATGGCSCRVTGPTSPGAAASLFALMILAAALIRRRRRI
jgi:MYXO-CTERM domain-containing protein